MLYKVPTVSLLVDGKAVSPVLAPIAEQRPGQTRSTLESLPPFRTGPSTVTPLKKRSGDNSSRDSISWFDTVGGVPQSFDWEAPLQYF